MSDRKSTMYKQCVLTAGTTVQTAWLPTKFAVPGKTITLDPDKETRWVVEAVGDAVRSHHDLKRKDVFASLL